MKKPTSLSLDILAFKAVFVALVLFASCKTVQLPTVGLTDSVRVEHIRDSILVPHDSIIVIAADSSMIEELIECDSTGKAYLRQIEGLKHGAKLWFPSLQLQNNLLTAKCFIDSQQVYLHWIDTHVTTNTGRAISTNTVVQLPPVTTNILTWWQHTQIWLCWILAAYTGFKLLIASKFNPLTWLSSIFKKVTGA